MASSNLVGSRELMDMNRLDDKHSYGTVECSRAPDSIVCKLAGAVPLINLSPDDVELQLAHWWIGVLLKYETRIRRFESHLT
ncbi:MAG TPA: hypothetical protein VIR79_06920 [Nitrospira sp.]